MVASERGYSAPMVNGGLKIRRNHHSFQSDSAESNHPLYASASYATANVNSPAGEQLPIGCGEWQMNTILRKPINSNQGGSYWGNARRRKQFGG